MVIEFRVRSRGRCPRWYSLLVGENRAIAVDQHCPSPAENKLTIVL